MYPGREDVERLEQEPAPRDREDPDHLSAEERPDAEPGEATAQRADEG